MPGELVSVNVLLRRSHGIKFCSWQRTNRDELWCDEALLRRDLDFSHKLEQARLESEAELMVQHSYRHGAENSFMKTLALASIHLNEEDTGFYKS